MNALRIESNSGFLESSSPTGIYNFDAERKTQLIALAMKCAEDGVWPSIPKLCKSIGIGTQTFYNHLKQDQEFASQWLEVKRTLESEIAMDMRVHAKRPGNYMDRVTLLRHLNPGEWGGVDPSSQNNMDLGWIKKLQEAFNPPIIATEAEITSTPLKDASNMNSKLDDK